MTVRPLFVLLAGALTCVADPIARAQSGIDELESSYQFLVTPRATGGALHTLTQGALKGVSLPLSFYDSDRYWGASSALCARRAVRSWTATIHKTTR
jgi:hypothetical protein